MNSQKHLFSLDPDVHYLNCAYKGPLLKSAEVACTKALIRNRNPYKIGVDDYFEGTQTVRKLFAELVNCEADNVAIIPATSYGFASALSGISGKANGKAIVVGEEFPSAYFSAEHWCGNNANKLHVIAAPKASATIGKEWNDAILNAIDESTSLVIISSVHWMSGLKFDLKAIGAQCKRVNAKFLVDGTQSVGAAPIDVNKCNIDALICAGYKWLLGPYSLGVAYIGNALLNGTPLEQSWMNRTNARAFSTLTDYEKAYREGAGKFNVGETSNFVLTPILVEGLRQINEWDVSNMQAYAKGLCAPLIHFLDSNNMLAIEPKFTSPHLFSLRMREGMSAEQMKHKLAAHNIIVSVRGENVRVSVNVFNDEHDIDALMQVLKE